MLIRRWWRTGVIITILRILWRRTGPRLQPDLKGRIHLIVGTADTFYLDGAAHKLEAVLNRLGGEPHFTYLPGKTHFDLYAVGDNRFGCLIR